jgi:zinc finger CCHC domain-containing protein 9
MGDDAGADEDDFHSFKRRNTEVSREEKREDKALRRLDVKTGAHSGTVKTFGKSPRVSTGKVVNF